MKIKLFVCYFVTVTKSVCWFNLDLDLIALNDEKFAIVSEYFPKSRKFAMLEKFQEFCLGEVRG